MNGVFWPHGGEPQAAKVCISETFTADYFQQKRCIPPFVKGTPKYMFNNIFNMKTEFLFKARLTVCHLSQQIFFQCCKTDQPEKMYSGCSFSFKERADRVYKNEKCALVRKKDQLSIQRIENKSKESLIKKKIYMWESTDSDGSDNEEILPSEIKLETKTQTPLRKKNWMKETLVSNITGNSQPFLEISHAKMLPNSSSDIQIKLMEINLFSDPKKEKGQWLLFFVCSCQCTFIFRIDAFPINLWNK